MSYFSRNIIFDVFSIKRYILFLLAINSFLKKPDLNLEFTFIYYLLVIIEEMSTFLGMLLNKKKEEYRPFQDGEILNLLSIFK